MRDWRKVVRAIVAVVACGSLTVPMAGAQVLYGSILGNVQDSSGAALPGATVSITSLETNLTRSTFTNEVGGYAFANVHELRFGYQVNKLRMDHWQPIGPGPRGYMQAATNATGLNRGGQNPNIYNAYASLLLGRLWRMRVAMSTSG